MIVHLLQLANAGTYPGKHDWFYPFKDRFLRRHGQRDGLFYDKQIIQKICYRCGGDGRYHSRCDRCRYQGSCWNCMYSDTDGFEDFDATAARKSGRCDRCGGSGFYMNRTVWLERWLYAGRVFHIPANAQGIPILVPDPVNVYIGYIQHARVDPFWAWRAALLLFAIFEFKTLTLAARQSIRNRWQKFRMGPIPF